MLRNQFSPMIYCLNHPIDPHLQWLKITLLDTFGMSLPSVAHLQKPPHFFIHEVALSLRLKEMVSSVKKVMPWPEAFSSQEGISA
jgi:hypothetical protein